MSSRTRVLIVDDSLVAREMLRQILVSDAAIEVVGTACDGQEAVEMVETLRPDLITMDIHMPRLDGLEAIERIMAFHPTPILVVSSSVYGEGIGRAFDALGAGALEVVKKPEPRDWAELEAIGRDIIRRVKVLSRVKVITHIRGKAAERQSRLTEAAAPERGKRQVGIVAIGSSTGGPTALQSVLCKIPVDLPVPILIAQHIADGFIPGLVEWLNGNCPITVEAALDGMQVRPGIAYLAPTGSNLEVVGQRVRHATPKSSQLYVPSADTLFESVAVSYRDRAVGVILTGMGADGAHGLKKMRDLGAHTIAQDEATCTVFGMPKAAIELGAAEEVLPVDSIGEAVTRLVAE